MPVIAIDLGTTGCKAAVFDGARVLGSAYRHYEYRSPHDGWAEQDAEAVWSLVSDTVKQALTNATGKPSIAALCVSVQGDAIMPIDSSGRALHPAILGMDTRSAAEADDLESRFGRGPLYSMTGMPCEPLNAITKVYWLQRNAPELRASLWKYVHYEEFLLMKIAGVPAIDFSMASRTMAFDPVRKEWCGAILEQVGITPGELGNVSASGVPVGIILGPVADDWGISRSAIVVAGGHDQCIAAIGAGVVEPDLACYSMGTAEVISTCFDAPNTSPAMLENNYPCYCHAAPGLYFTISLNQSGGLSLEWFTDILHDGWLSEEDRREAYARHIGALELVPSPVLFLPHIVGSGTPACDHLSRGAFLGLSLKTGRQEMFQSVVDALAFEARLNLEVLDLLGIPVTELRAVGGGARSERILELKATVLRRPVRLLENPEAALLGAAILAQVAVGEFKDLTAACSECVRIARTVEPNLPAASAYDAAFERFRQLYPALRGFYHNWRTTCPQPVNA
jgi:xylulokinase